MPNPDRFIASCTSWDDFYERTKKLSAGGEKGAVFERLTQLYLQTTPEYRTKLQHVWLLPEVPADIRRRLNLPGPDEGASNTPLHWSVVERRLRWPMPRGKVTGVKHFRRGAGGSWKGLSFQITSSWHAGNDYADGIALPFPDNSLRQCGLVH